MQSHIVKSHSTADVELYEDLFKLQDDEIVLMKGVYLAKPRKSKKKAKQLITLRISEGHSSRLALRYVLVILSFNQ